ncbi:hypothetical protein GCM10019059_26140 [Camelimonas fluminis]|uniref:DUF808 domain-containing protein n=1 Tax=Camelimonas fluminis TaxID=1576911 RepID=A0ABV7UNF7_9HYPH|nr:DUF808 domain-containing protein [Camelimonas fluminis]GHE65186.1 hypothetical protein GCM10019059_26140 [Camelimonas fluminis]
MSGLLALLDDVAALTRLTAASLDDIAANAAKAGSKTLGVVIDDAAVTPAYVNGVHASRELPMIGRIALGSLRNKVALAPALLFLNWFYPPAITALLLVGGAYLCFEGAEKIWHVLAPGADHAVSDDMSPGNPASLEQARVQGAIKTDFILSAEIMTVALSVITTPSPWLQAAALLAVGVMVTAGVYGAVAIIVKLDDAGLFMARAGRFAPTRALGRLMVRSLPAVLGTLSVIGTAAMLWVGGSIVLHSLHAFGLHAPADIIARMSAAAGGMAPGAAGAATTWITGAALDGVAGLALGLAIIPLTNHLVSPMLRLVTGKRSN